MHDVTDFVRNDKLRCINKKGYHMLERIKMSTETLSHDMRAPLASIIMIVTLLLSGLSKKSEFSKSKQLKLLTQIKSQANLLMNFAHDLLDIRQITLN